MGKFKDINLIIEETIGDMEHLFKCYEVPVEEQITAYARLKTEISKTIEIRLEKLETLNTDTIKEQVVDIFEENYLMVEQ